MRITIEEFNGMAKYVAAYVTEEIGRGRTEITREMILDAIFNFFGDKK